VLLNHQSSPILSNLQSSSRYATEKLPETIDEYRSTVKNGETADESVDLNRIINDFRSLGKTEDQLIELKTALKKVDAKLDQTKEKLSERAD